MMTGCLLRKHSGAWRSVGMYNVRQDRYVKPKVHDASSSEKVALALIPSGHNLYVSHMLPCCVNCCLGIASNEARVRSALKGPPVGGHTSSNATVHMPRSSSGQVQRKITALIRIWSRWGQATEEKVAGLDGGRLFIRLDSEAHGSMRDGASMSIHGASGRSARMVSDPGSTCDMIKSEVRSLVVAHVYCLRG